MCGIDATWQCHSVHTRNVRMPSLTLSDVRVLRRRNDADVARFVSRSTSGRNCARALAMARSHGSHGMLLGECQNVLSAREATLISDRPSLSVRMSSTSE